MQTATVSSEPTRILVVDDEEGMQAALREVLGRRGYSVDCANHGAAALTKMGTERYGLVISDVRMPKMGGMEFLDTAIAKYPRTPFVMMTAYGAVEDAVEAMKKGACDYLIKPFSFETVETVVAGALASKNAEETQSDAMGDSEVPTASTSSVSSISSASNPVGRGSQHNKAMIACNPAMKRLLGLVNEVADGTATVMIQGESGVGKEILAREIHKRGPRKDKPFVAVNCAALPEGLLESELFGHEKGSFTGAILSRKGKFEQAHGGIILLDEISEMPLSLQAKLLRVLQEHEIEPIGSTKPISLDIRVIATTNRDLKQWVKDGHFREDLYYRLNVISMVIPPLRDRREDVLPLADRFLEKHCRRNNRPQKRLSRELEGYLLAQNWHGNVRELENFIERAVLLCRDEVITPNSLFLDASGDNLMSQALDAHTIDTDEAMREAHSMATTAGTSLPEPAAATHSSQGISAPIPQAPVTLEEMERMMIVQTLERVGGNRTRAAELLGVSVRTIRNKIHQYELAGV